MSVFFKKFKFQTKDLITIGIFSLLFAIVLFVFAGVMGIFPIAFLFYSAFGAVPCGVIYLYVISKIPRTGTITIMSFIVSMIYFLVGAYALAPLFGFAGGILAELISSWGNYKNNMKNGFGYTVYTLSLWFGFMSPMIFHTEAYIEKSVNSGYSKDYVLGMINFVNGPLFYTAMAASISGAFLGIFLGRKMLKKHFGRAGFI